MERRVLQLHEIRMSGNGNCVTGVAARYGVRANLGKFYERVSKRAFDKILAQPGLDCCFLVNHNPDLILGRTSAGTLKLRADDTGLHYSCELPNTSTARDLKENIRAGNISGNSFAFTLGEGDDEWSEEEDENRSRIVVRTIKNFSQLLDVSAVVYPAYKGTSVSLDERAIRTAAEFRSRSDRSARVQAIADMRGIGTPGLSSPLLAWARRRIDHRVRNERLARLDD
jgi:uncharacterized protein